MTFNEILNYFRDSIRAFCNKKLNFSENSFVYGLGQAVASLGIKIMAALDNTETRTSLLTATGEDLEAIFANFKLTRKQASTAKGFINIWLLSSDFANQTEPTIIYAGSSVDDKDGNSFIVTETCVIPSKLAYYPSTLVSSMTTRMYAIPLKNNTLEYSESGSLNSIREQFIDSIEIAIESESTGVQANTPSSYLTTYRGSLLYCNNREPITGGTDIEDDESFRYRGLSFIKGANSKFSYYSIQHFLLSQDSILDANIIEDYNCLSFIPPRVGHVYAIINTTLSPVLRDTSEPYVVDSPRNIYQKIRNSIETEMYRPLGIGITVREADVLNVNFKSTSENNLKIYIKSNAITSIKETELKQLIYEYFLNTKIGQDIYKSDIYSLLKTDSDVIDIEDFSFMSVYGVDVNGNELYNTVSVLTASCNQVYRIKAADNINLVCYNLE